MFFHPIGRFLRGMTLAASLVAGPALAAEIVVTDAWVRATVPAQKSTGAFLNIVAPADATLIGASSPAAGITELHTMRTISGIMRMRSAKEVTLPANQTVSLQPGGTHVMLMELKEPLTEGQFVPLTLTVRNADGQEEQIELEVPVKPITTR
jgi:copper(I)-binding protein